MDGSSHPDIQQQRGVCENTRQQWSKGFGAIPGQKAPIAGSSAVLIAWFPQSYAKALFSFMK